MKYWEEITNRLLMSDVVMTCGLRPNRGGFICCPFHNEKTPSMKIYKDRYYCFGCHLGGNAIDFISRFYNISFKDACRKLNQDFNLGLDGEIDKNLNFAQKRMLRAKIESENRKRQEAERIERIENGHIECSDIDIKYEDMLYETTTECSMNELLEKNGMSEFVDHSNHMLEEPNIVKRFRSNLIGTNDFDDLVTEYTKKVDDLHKAMLVNKKIREEEENE